MTARVKFAQVTGVGLNRCRCELPVFCRLRLTAYLAGALCRSSKYPRGCFASLTQGPQRLFPRFAPTLSRSGKKARLPAVGRQSCPNVPDQARSAGREESPCVHASSLLSALQSKRKISATTKKSFSLLDRARPVFSFSALRKRENGGCNEPAIIMAEFHPARQGEKKPSRPKGGHPRPAPVGRNPPSPARGRTPPPSPLPGAPQRRQSL